MISYEDSVNGKAFSVLVRLALPPYTIHFKSPSYMKEVLMERLDKNACKETLKASAQKPEVRLVSINNSSIAWTRLY